MLLAIFALTPAFFYIPNACLSAVIIHAVADLFSGPKVWKQVSVFFFSRQILTQPQYWQVSPFELLVFVLGVVITFFTTVEIGVYVSVSFSLLLLLIRIARPRFSVIGRIPVYSRTFDNQEENLKETGSAGDPERYLYVPMDHSSVKSTAAIEPMPPGIVVVRLGNPPSYSCNPN